MTSIPDSSLIVQFSSKIRRIEIDGELYFSILDVFEHFGSKGSAVNPAIYWSRVEKRLQKQVANEVITGLLYRTPDTGGRQSPYAAFKTFMRIVQVSEIREWEYLRDWMADLAQERAEEIANPELGIHRAQSRFLDAKMAQGMTADEAVAFLREVQEGRIIRKQWTTTLKSALRFAIEGWQYGQVTNTEYRTLYGTDAKTIIAQTGFKTARDGMTTIGRSILNTAELALDAEFKQYENLTFQEALRLTKEVCEIFALPVGRIEARLGISLATGLPLLHSGNDVK